MYHYLSDPNFKNALKKEESKLSQELCHQLNIDHKIGSRVQLIGSAKRNMITQNENEPVDLDYNLIIVKAPINDAKELKNAIMKSFNKVLRRNGYDDCQDSTWAISTRYYSFKKGNQTEFKFDIGIVKEDKEGNWQRLIHLKTGSVQSDTWIWNKTPETRNIKAKEAFIKSKGKWSLLKERYLKYKNDNLRFNNNDLYSFTCYERAVNDVYSHLKNRERIWIFSLFLV